LSNYTSYSFSFLACLDYQKSHQTCLQITPKLTLTGYIGNVAFGSVMSFFRNWSTSELSGLHRAFKCTYAIRIITGGINSLTMAQNQ